MLATIIHGEEIIAESNADIRPIVDAIAPLKDINATNATQLKEQLVELNKTLDETRKALLKS